MYQMKFFYSDLHAIYLLKRHNFMNIYLFDVVLSKYCCLTEQVKSIQKVD